MITTFICPHCKKEVEISQALRHQVEEDLRKNLEDSIKKELEEKTATEVKDLKLDLQRQLDSERQKIQESVLKNAQDEHRLKDLEKDKKLQEALEKVRE